MGAHIGSSVSVLHGICPTTDDEDDGVVCKQRFLLNGGGVTDGDTNARFCALIPLAVVFFLGEAKRLPRFKEGRLEESPWRKCRLHTRVWLWISSSLMPRTSSHCFFLFGSAGILNIDIF